MTGNTAKVKLFSWELQLKYFNIIKLRTKVFYSKIKFEVYRHIFVKMCNIIRKIKTSTEARSVIYIYCSSKFLCMDLLLVFDFPFHLCLLSLKILLGLWSLICILILFDMMKIFLQFSWSLPHHKHIYSRKTQISLNQ